MVSRLVGMTTTEDTTSRTGTPGGIVSCAATVTRTLAAVADAPGWGLSAAEQRTVLAELSRAQSMLAELRLRVLAAADVSGVGAESGASSTAAWLAHATRATRPRAHAEVRLANALEGEFGLTRRALATGTLNEEQARVIVHAITDLPDTIGEVDRRRAEDHLVDQAQTFDARALRVLGKHLLEVLDPETAEQRLGRKLEDEERRARRKTWFRIRDNGDGTSTGSFKIPTLHAQMLTKALHALTAPRRTNPGTGHPSGTGGTSGSGGGGTGGFEAGGAARRPAYPALLGRGLLELIEHLPTEKLPTSGGLAATIVVTLDYETLRTGLGVAALDTGGTISAAEARRLACEAGIIPLVLGGDSQPLDIGRERRLHTRYQRLALAHRDKGCTAETCDRPPGWTQAHHETPWSRGGGTSVENGRLLCSWHHHLVHHPGYTTTRLPNGSLRFHRRT